MYEHKPTLRNSFLRAVYTWGVHTYRVVAAGDRSSPCFVSSVAGGVHAPITAVIIPRSSIGSATERKKRAGNPAEPKRAMKSYNNKKKIYQREQEDKTYIYIRYKT